MLHSLYLQNDDEIYLMEIVTVKRDNTTLQEIEKLHDTFNIYNGLSSRNKIMYNEGMRLVAENLIFLDTFEGFICIFSSDQYVII